MNKITFEKSIRADQQKVFDIVTNFEDFERLLPEFYPSIVIKSIRDESSLVSEHLKIADKEFVIMAKHFSSPPEKHVMRVVGGDIKGSYIKERFVPVTNGTKIIVEAELNIPKSIDNLFNINKYQNSLKKLYEKFIGIVESN